jgi:hypothetical protein
MEILFMSSEEKSTARRKLRRSSSNYNGSLIRSSRISRNESGSFQWIPLHSKTSSGEVGLFLGFVYVPKSKIESGALHILVPLDSENESKVVKPEAPENEIDSDAEINVEMKTDYNSKVELKKFEPESKWNFEFLKLVLILTAFKLMDFVIWRCFQKIC